MLESRVFYSHGKLLISGEYLVLDGAKALALPVKKGQSLHFETSKSPGLTWTATQPGGIWFRASFELPGLNILQSTDPEIALNLQKHLQAAVHLNTKFLDTLQNHEVTTYLEFNREWGFGSSSTLVANIAAWAGVDPFDLHWAVSKGSGYDIACAGAEGPVFYSINDGKPVIKPVKFHPDFSDSIYFVYLGKKQNSGNEIAEYKKKGSAEKGMLLQISNISESMVQARSLEEFSQLMKEHEKLLGSILSLPTLDQTLFKGFPGTAKSLGAWGGDFAMIASEIGEESMKEELSRLGLKTCFSFDDLIL